MKNYFKIPILCMSLCLIHSCVGGKETDINDKAFPEYDSEKQVIYYKEQLNQDVKADIISSYDFSSSMSVLLCQFSFFNYGDDIRLFNGCLDDIFVTGLGKINVVYALSNNDEISALQFLSVDSPHKSASQISSCNGTRRTAGHVHPEVRI